MTTVILCLSLNYSIMSCDLVMWHNHKLTKSLLSFCRMYLDDWKKKYESLTDMVAPRSSKWVMRMAEKLVMLWMHFIQGFQVVGPIRVLEGQGETFSNSSPKSSICKKLSYNWINGNFMECIMWCILRESRRGYCLISFATATFYKQRHRLNKINSENKIFLYPELSTLFEYIFSRLEYNFAVYLKYTASLAYSYDYEF